MSDEDTRYIFSASLRQGERESRNAKMYFVLCGFSAILITKAKFSPIYMTILLNPQFGLNDCVRFFLVLRLYKYQGQKWMSQNATPTVWCHTQVERCCFLRTLWIKNSSSVCATKKNYLHTFSREPVLSTNYSSLLETEGGFMQSMHSIKLQEVDMRQCRLSYNKQHPAKTCPTSPGRTALGCARRQQGLPGGRAVWWALLIEHLTGLSPVLDPSWGTSHLPSSSTIWKKPQTL